MIPLKRFNPLSKNLFVSYFFLNFAIESSSSTGWTCVFKTYWFDAHTAMPREGTTAMTSRKDNRSLLLVVWVLPEPQTRDK